MKPFSSPAIMPNGFMISKGNGRNSAANDPIGMKAIIDDIDVKPPSICCAEPPWAHAPEI